MTEIDVQNRCLGYARVSTVGQTLTAQLDQLSMQSVVVCWAVHAGTRADGAAVGAHRAEGFGRANAAHLCSDRRRAAGGIVHGRGVSAPSAWPACVVCGWWVGSPHRSIRYRDVSVFVPAVGPAHDDFRQYLAKPRYGGDRWAQSGEGMNTYLPIHRRAMQRRSPKGHDSRDERQSVLYFPFIATVSTHSPSLG